MSRETKQPRQGESITLMTPKGEFMESEVVSIKGGKLWFKDKWCAAKQMGVTLTKWRINWNKKGGNWFVSSAGDESWETVQKSRVGLSKGAL